MVINKSLSFDDLFLGNEEDQHYQEPTQVDMDVELISSFDMCGSCVHFQYYQGEAGFCDIAENNCICTNPKAMIDIWDNKCKKWTVSPRLIEDIKRSASGFTCPYCERVSDLRPIAKTETEFVERNGDTCYVWDEVHKCTRCNNLYVLENGT